MQYIIMYDNTLYKNSHYNITLFKFQIIEHVLYVMLHDLLSKLLGKTKIHVHWLKIIAM